MKTQGTVARLIKIGLVSAIGLGSSVALPAASVLPQQSSANPELPNFHQVNEKLYRGAQPKKDGLKRLYSLGIKTVLNLREQNESAQREETEASAAGLRYFNIPFKRAGRPTDAQIESVLAILDKAENQPVFVHCRQGADRTGLVIAIYRITHEGWNSERAKAEANKYGMHPWEIGMKNYIHDYYQRRQKFPPTVTPTPG